MRSKVATFAVAAQRFWRLVSRTEGCWLWQGSKSRNGYGNYGITVEKGTGSAPGKRLRMTAHRFAWYFTHGELPKLLVLHRCDNRACVNPEHLFLGTHADNVTDMYVKGRQAKNKRPGGCRGERHYKARLTELCIREIRARYRRGLFGQYRLAREYGVCREAIRDILTGRNWKHVQS